MRPIEPGSVPQTPFGKRLVKEAETLAKFKKRLDKVLTDLDKSPASRKTISQQSITRDAYGSGPGFTSADDLANLYEKVHARLETLSKSFGDQIEAMGLMAIFAERGYDGMDAEQARRMREIQARTREHYREPTEKHAGQNGNHSGKDAGGDAL
ncbi:hypothetical protein HUF15_43140 [Streptomyces samsunensis]|uniref:Uncharacterized protein n=1 Tax=Streptomyces autolyticus TaxID=75293 RepID=A0ABM6HJR5_9ACTN|nr:hypothetical protein BV401_32080 [Streptomyces autolyticus]NUH43414.1 hypothetical protein [Streptomyces samsunensis]